MRQDIPQLARAIVYVYMYVTVPYKKETQTPMNPNDREINGHTYQEIVVLIIMLWWAKDQPSWKESSPARDVCYYVFRPMGIRPSQQDPKPKHVET